MPVGGRRVDKWWDIGWFREYILGKCATSTASCPSTFTASTSTPPTRSGRTSTCSLFRALASRLRDAIRRRPKSDYEAILKTLSQDADPYSGYYMEWMWSDLFRAPNLGGVRSAPCAHIPPRSRVVSHADAMNDLVRRRSSRSLSTTVSSMLGNLISGGVSGFISSGVSGFLSFISGGFISGGVSGGYHCTAVSGGMICRVSRAASAAASAAVSAASGGDISGVASPPPASPVASPIASPPSSSPSASPPPLPSPPAAAVADDPGGGGGAARLGLGRLHRVRLRRRLHAYRRQLDAPGLCGQAARAGRSRHHLRGRLRRRGGGDRRAGGYVDGLVGSLTTAMADPATATAFFADVPGLTITVQSIDMAPVATALESGLSTPVQRGAVAGAVLGTGAALALIVVLAKRYKLAARLPFKRSMSVHDLESEPAGKFGATDKYDAMEGASAASSGLPLASSKPMEEEPPAASKGAAVAERDGDVEAPAPAQRLKMSPRPTGGPQDGAPRPRLRRRLRRPFCMRLRPSAGLAGCPRQQRSGRTHGLPRVSGSAKPLTPAGAALGQIPARGVSLLVV